MNKLSVRLHNVDSTVCFLEFLDDMLGNEVIMVNFVSTESTYEQVFSRQFTRLTNLESMMEDMIEFGMLK